MVSGDIVALLREIVDGLTVSKDEVDVRRDALLTINEVCKLIKCGDDTLRKMIKKGAFPSPINVAGQKRWPTSLINQHIINSNKELAEKQDISDELMAEIKKSRGKA